MICVAIKDYGGVAVIAAAILGIAVGEWLLMWPLISFIHGMKDKIQFPAGKDRPEFWYTSDKFLKIKQFTLLAQDPDAFAAYQQREQEFTNYATAIFPKAFKFIMSDNHKAATDYGKAEAKRAGIFMHISWYVLLLSAVCIAGQIFGILLMTQNEDIRGTYKDEGVNGVTQPQFIVISTLLSAFAGLSYLLYLFLPYVKDAMPCLPYFAAKFSLLGVIGVNFIFNCIYFPFLLLAVILAAALAFAMWGILLCSPVGWVFTYYMGAVRSMVEKNVEDNDRRNHDHDEHLLDHNSDTFFYFCLSGLILLYAIYFVAFCIAIEMTGSFEETNVCVRLAPLQNITGIIISVAALVGVTKDTVWKLVKGEFCSPHPHEEHLRGGFKGTAVRCCECGEEIVVRTNKARIVMCSKEHFTDCVPACGTSVGAANL